MTPYPPFQNFHLEYPFGGHTIVPPPINHDFKALNPLGVLPLPSTAGSPPSSFSSQSSMSPSPVHSATVAEASETTTRPPRPPNPFILFRSEICKSGTLRAIESSSTNISRIVGHLWHALDVDDRQKYKKMAEDARKKHAKQYPDYKFCPRPPKKSKNRRRKRIGDDGEVKCRKLGELLIDGLRGDELRRSSRNLGLVPLTPRTEKVAKPRVKRQKATPTSASIPQSHPYFAPPSSSADIVPEPPAVSHSCPSNVVPSPIDFSELPGLDNTVDISFYNPPYENALTDIQGDIIASSSITPNDHTALNPSSMLWTSPSELPGIPGGVCGSTWTHIDNTNSALPISYQIPPCQPSERSIQQSNSFDAFSPFLSTLSEQNDLEWLEVVMNSSART